MCKLIRKVDMLIQLACCELHVAWKCVYHANLANCAAERTWRTELLEWMRKYDRSSRLCMIQQLQYQALNSWVWYVGGGEWYVRRFGGKTWEKGTTWKNLRIEGRITLTLNLLTWKICWASNNASKWQMGFNSVFKKLKRVFRKWDSRVWIRWV
jgi:hypothetical protein